MKTTELPLMPALALVVTWALSTASAQTVFPGGTWATRTPAEVGMNGGKLDEFARRVGGDGVIIKDGYLVKSWGRTTRLGDWASAAKPVLSTLLLLAVNEGKLAGVDALVKDSGWALSEKDATMTFRHLADMVSGYACAEPPGAAWGYNDYGIQLYANSLERVFGTALDGAIRERLASLQFEDGAIFGSRRELGVQASPRDFARIGWFWLNEGVWEGKPLIAKEIFTAHIRPGVPASLPRTKGKDADYLGIGSFGGGTDQTPHGPGVYGFNFWFNHPVGKPARRAWPALPPDAYQANGMWNRDTVTIVPSLRMVVAVRGGKLGPFEPGEGDGEANRNLKLLVAPTASTGGGPAVLPAISHGVTPPYPRSEAIEGIEFDWSTHRREAIGSDNWPVTWADDGRLYAAWGDGGGFGGDNKNGRVTLGVARVEGDAVGYTGKNVWGGFEPEHAATFGGKSYGILSVAGILSMWVVPQPGPHLKECRLVSSGDHGATWKEVEWAFRFEESLSIPTFLNFGRDYEGARDGYVYSYFIEPQWGPKTPADSVFGFEVHRPGRIHLSRAPKAALLKRDGHEIFAGLDAAGQPRWSRNVADKKPVFSDSNGVGWNVSVSYNAGLKRYLLATEHGATHVGKFGLFDAPEPWGPWTTVVYDEAWGEGHVEVSAFYWNFPTKWFKADGTGFTMVFTGKNTNDSWNTVDGKFLGRTSTSVDP